MVQKIEFAQFLERRIQLVLLAALSLLCISCSTPPVPNSVDETSYSYFAYTECMQAYRNNPSVCNQVGVTRGMSYVDYTVAWGGNPYVNDYQPTGSILQGQFYRQARAVAYKDYLDALPLSVQGELATKWIRLARVAPGASVH